MSWVDLRERSPIDITRVVSHANSFNSLVGIRISINNLNRAKKSLIDASGEIDLIFTSLYQLLYEREVLKNRIDEILYGWLVDNVGRYLKKLDELEEELLIKFDEVNSDIKRVGISRLSSYAKALKIANSIVYESLFKSIKEYESIQETDKIKKEPRTFLYIFFHVLQISMSVVGGLAREGKQGQIKKGQVGNVPTTWQSLISPEGQKRIAKKHEEETGEKIDIPDSIVDHSGEGSSGDTDENTLFVEEVDEGEEQDGDN
jgi:hypothetical protein